MVKAVCLVLIFVYRLYSFIGWSTLLMPLMIGIKYGFDHLTKEWRQKGNRRKRKVHQMRGKYLNMSLNNIKTVKLYSWQNLFSTLVQKYRDMEEGMRYESELR